MPATASSVQDGDASAWGPGNAVDGDEFTRWSSEREDDQHWQVDLGRVRSVDRVQIDWEAAFASRYQILTSLDGTTWTVAGETTQSSEGVRTTTFSTRPARYVRVLGSERGTHYGISFFDARVFGPADDTTSPNTSVTSGPSGGTEATSASFGFSSDEAGSTFRCKLDSGAWEACTSPKAYSNLALGAHTFSVEATDPSGNVDATPAGRSFAVVDQTAPETSITAGPGAGSTIASASPSFSFTSPEPDAAFECKLDAGAWAACASPRALTSLGDGSHTFSVRAKDAAGNTDPTPDGRTFTVDTTAPNTAIGSGPSGTITQTAASFAFTGEAGGSFECRLDAGAWATCASPKAYTGLAQGSHTFQLRAKDAAGNTDQTPAERTFTVDTAAPDTSITVGLPAGGTITEPGTSFSFTSPELGATFECRLDTGAWAACTSPHSLTALGDGSHTFAVRAKDAAGNADATPAARTFTVDTELPETAIGSGPSGTVASTSATFGFTGDGSSFECNLDSGGWSACTSPEAYTGLGQGAHTFEVRAKDAAGNVDATPASRSFTVDTAAPDTAIATGPSGQITATSASFSFSGEPGGSFECNLDDGGWSACTSPKAYTGLGQGAHTFQLRAKDAAGNTDQTPATRTFSVDTVAPDTTIGSGPSGDITATSASFGFSSEAGASFQCKLDSGAWESCTSPKAYSGLSTGAHSFEVRATDAAGNTDQSSATRAFRVVAPPGPPETTIDSAPIGTITSSSVQVTFSGSGATRYECKLDSGSWVACTSPRALAGLGEGAHIFSVRAFNSAGDPDPTPASRSFSVDTTPPDTTISSGPTGDITATSASFGFSGEGGATFECRLDSGTWSACGSPKTFTGLSVAAHTVEVRARDAFGRYDPTPASRSFRVVDRTPPNTTITAGPSGTVTGSSQRFTFSSEAGATFQCRMNTGPWANCVSPRTIRKLKVGAHSFYARAIDAAGNVDATPARRNFRVAAGSARSAPSSVYATAIGSTPGLTALYGLGDKGASARATSARPGAYHGSPKRVSALVRGSGDSHARRFDGRNDWIALDPRTLGRRKRFSVELWLEFAKPRRGVILALYGPRGSGLGLDLGADGRPRLSARSTRRRSARATGPRLRRGRTHHLVATFDGRRLRLYVNGKLSATTRYGSGIGAGRGTRLTLGARPGSTGRFTGTLDELGLYDRALSGATIRSHYSAGR